MQMNERFDRRIWPWKQKESIFSLSSIHLLTRESRLSTGWLVSSDSKALSINRFSTRVADGVEPKQAHQFIALHLQLSITTSSWLAFQSGSGHTREYPADSVKRRYSGDFKNFNAGTSGPVTAAARRHPTEKQQRAAFRHRRRNRPSQSAPPCG